jgi:DNA-binding transcriptional ArsR family regulator
MLEELSPHIHVAPDETLVIRPPATKDVDPLELDLVNQDQITLVPSHFVWPELTATVQRDLQAAGERKTVTITYALEKMQHEARPPAPPEDLLKLLRSAGDPTRLQILHLLGRRPRSTREVAGLIGLTEAAISKHLKLLQEAGWIEPERRGYYVYYRPVQDSRARLTQAIDHLLGD